jgi:hypothetical protein
MHESIAAALAEAEEMTAHAAAGCLDALRELALVRGELHELQRRFAAAESLGPDDIRSAESELAHAFVMITQTAKLMIRGGGKLLAVVEEPPSPSP